MKKPLRAEPGNRIPISVMAYWPARASRSRSPAIRARRPRRRPRPAGTVFGAYLDLEVDILTDVLLTAAGRFVHHEGIGESLNGKLAARWSLLDDYLALRGSIGTNFRAPTVGQATIGI